MFDNQEVIIVAAIISLLLLIVYLVIDAAYMRRQRMTKLERDARMTKAYDDLGYEQDTAQAVELEREKSLLAKVLEQFMRILGMNMDSAQNAAKKKLLHAGIISPNAPVYLLFYQRVISVLCVIIGVVFLLKGDTISLLVGGIIIIIGVFGAKLYVTNAIQKRQQKLLRSFPDGLDLMVVCVESGLALDAAMNRVCDELAYAHPELAQELNQTRLELALLNNRAQALMNLAERTNLVAYRSLVAALIQTERFGTNLTDTLRVLSEDYRQTRLMKAEEKAGRLPALMAIPLITLLLPAIFMLVLGPPVIRVVQQGGLFGNN